MTRWVRRRLGDRSADEGVYAVLYAVLVVVLIGLASIVVDFAAVRQDRRLDRSAADSAAIGGAQLLDPAGATGRSVYGACLRSWDYLSTTLRITTPGTACAAFTSYQTEAQVSAYCGNGSSDLAEIDDNQTIGTRTFRVAWPVPSNPALGTGFLTPDIAPGAISGGQPFNATFDGTVSGCDRLGVAVFHTQSFVLGEVFGSSSTQTQTHSVSRFNPNGGPADEVAALNVLNPTDCNSLVTTGGGQVLVGPTVRGTTVVGPGSIAVESNATSSCSGSGTYAINPTTGNGSLICASSVVLTAATSCDGKGVIQSHALDPGGNAAKAYDPAATSGGNLQPVPISEGAPHGYAPVTSRYGCNTTRLPCSPPPKNYIADLETAYGGTSTPTVYTDGALPYTDPYTDTNVYPFTPAPSSVCANISTTVVLEPGNWFANCSGSIDIKNGGTLIVKGGNLVVSQGIKVASGGCLVVNSAVSTCPTSISPIGASTASATSLTPPTSNSVVFLRGGSLSNSGTLILPQTFVYSAGASNSPVVVNGSTLTLWTAPGAGAVDSTGRTLLEQQCYDPAASAVNVDCLNSRFASLTYWSDYAAPSAGSASNSFNGQGNLNVVGVFFTPKGYFNFTGGGTYTAAAAQFWADKLNANGGAVVGLAPDARFAIPSSSARESLIR